MCLITKQIKPLIAEKDIVVYKSCEVLKMSFYEIGLWGYFQVTHQYSKKETAVMCSETSRSGESFIISKGLHAYVSVYGDSGINTKWIIPKGSEYYLSEYGTQMVSNQLVFKRMIGTKYWLKKIVWRKN